MHREFEWIHNNASCNFYIELQPHFVVYSLAWMIEIKCRTSEMQNKMQPSNLYLILRQAIWSPLSAHIDLGGRLHLAIFTVEDSTRRACFSLQAKDFICCSGYILNLYLIKY